MYGVTHVAAINGHSRFVVVGTTMPIINNLQRKLNSIFVSLLNALVDIFELFILPLMLSCFSGQFFKNIFNDFFLIVPDFYH